MPAYAFICPEHGAFERDFSFSEYDELRRDKDKNATTSCPEPKCRKRGIRTLQLFGNISTSDDPSFGSRKGEKRNREFQGFDPDNQGWMDRGESTNKGWEHA